MQSRFFVRPAALACLVLSLPAFAADMAPDAMVQKVAGETLTAIKADKAKRYAAYSEIDFYSMNNARRERAKMVIKRKRDGR